MRVKLYVVRHGHTENNIRKIINGRHDSPLVASGIQESIATGEFLRNVTFKRVYVSDLGRCIATLSYMDIPGVPHSGLRDRDFGEYNGKPYQLYHDSKLVYRKMVMEKGGREGGQEPPAPHTSPLREIDEVELPGVEEYRHLYARVSHVVKSTLAEILSEGDEEAEVLFVTHCSLVRMCALFLQQFSSVKYKGNLRYSSVSNNSISEFDIQLSPTGEIENVDTLKLFNVEHLRKGGDSPPPQFLS